MSKEMNGMQPAAKENKFRHTARRTIIKNSRPQGQFRNPRNLGPTDRGSDQPKLTSLHIQLQASNSSVYPVSLSCKVH